MSDGEKSKVSGWEKWGSVAALAVSIVSAVFAYWQGRAARDDFAESSRTRELDWNPVLNILSITSTAENDAPLGVFLQNVGKGPAKITAVCQAHPFDELKSLDGLRQSQSRIQPGDVLGADEKVSLIEFRPIAQESWDPTRIRNVQMALRTLESQGSSITICYESMYQGCFVAKRGPDAGEGWRQARIKGCVDPCCQHP